MVTFKRMAKKLDLVRCTCTNVKTWFKIRPSAKIFICHHWRPPRRTRMMVSSGGEERKLGSPYGSVGHSGWAVLCCTVKSISLNSTVKTTAFHCAAMWKALHLTHCSELYCKDHTAHWSSFCALHSIQEVFAHNAPRVCSSPFKDSFAQDKC